MVCIHGRTLGPVGSLYPITIFVEYSDELAEGFRVKFNSVACRELVEYVTKHEAQTVDDKLQMRSPGHDGLAIRDIVGVGRVTPGFICMSDSNK